ncbi:hypothetical protein [Pandoraea sputorum]|uniref:Fis family transcriptional regulator n=1 Tax=Pandoraea sputorum TaxID=93222 RepID=A0A5E5BGH5_9BURK|nr:hypothetical protein [Pandoraea sputorum]VVE84377.1 hypothetical protein PSP31121_04732 [Pandoraea sputorum]
MSTKKSHRAVQLRSPGARASVQRMPIPQAEVARIVLRVRLALERLRGGETNRQLIHALAEVTLITTFVTEAGHGDLSMALLERTEHDLAAVLVRADATGEWKVPRALVEDLTRVVNEYDRQLSQVRLAAIADACRRFKQLMAENAAQALTVNRSEGPGAY